MLPVILYVFSALFIIIILLGLFLKSRFTLIKTIIINTNKKNVFNYIDDLHEWKNWSAWSADNDSNIKIEYKGREKGAGSIMSWKGKKMGRGMMEIIQTDPYREIKVLVKFNKGLFKINHIFLLEDLNASTKVTWTAAGRTKRSGIAKLLGKVFVKWMGNDMETALKILKNISENK